MPGLGGLCDGKPVHAQRVRLRQAVDKRDDHLRAVSYVFATIVALSVLHQLVIHVACLADVGYRKIQGDHNGKQ